MSDIAPFLSCVGGKRHMIQLTLELLEAMPPPLRVFSPFLGAGALELAIAQKFKHAELYLSDINARLINAWAHVVANPDRVAEVLAFLDREGNREIERQRMNAELAPSTPYEAAAMIWLVKRSFSSLYRVNSRNEFNAALNTRKRQPLPTQQELRAISRLMLQRALFLQRPFHAVLSCEESTSEFRPGDLLICDPPYLDTFDGYSGHAWDEESLKRLLRGCLTALRQGARVLVYELADTLIPRLIDTEFPGLRARIYLRSKTHFMNGAVRAQPIECIALLYAHEPGDAQKTWADYDL